VLGFGLVVTLAIWPWHMRRKEFLNTLEKVLVLVWSWSDAIFQIKKRV
jgi:hypothetical protein